MSHNNIHKIRKLIDENLVLYPNYILKFLHSKVLKGNFSNDLMEEEELLITHFWNVFKDGVGKTIFIWPKVVVCSEILVREIDKDLKLKQVVPSIIYFLYVKIFHFAVDQSHLSTGNNSTSPHPE